MRKLYMEETPITLIGFKQGPPKTVKKETVTSNVRKTIGIGHPAFLLQQYLALFSLHYITF